MRRKDKEITNKADIESILKEAFVCHLGLSDGDRPYVVPMNYAYEDGHIYLHGAAEGKKMDILKKNDKVCFEMELFRREIIKPGDQPCDWGTAYQSVMGFGNAKLLQTDEEKIRALNLIIKPHDGGSFTFPERMLKLTAVIDITIEEMTGKRADG